MPVTSSEFVYWGGFSIFSSFTPVSTSTGAAAVTAVRPLITPLLLINQTDIRL